MMTAAVWTLISLLFGGLIAFVVDSRNGRRELRTELRTEIGGLRTEVHLLAERQAEMNGRLDVVVAQAHTHPVVVAGP